MIELAMVHDDRRKYLTALISLSVDHVSVWAKKNGCGDLSFEQITSREDLKNDIQNHVDQTNSRLARFETIKKFIITPHPFQVETGELTPTLKVRRSVVEQKYRELLDSLYE